MPAPAAQTPRAPAAAPASTPNLAVGLGRLGEILLDLAAREIREGQPCVIDGGEIGSLFDHRLYDARRTFEERRPGAWKGLQAAVLGDRDAYDLFVRNPDNEKVARELLYLRGTEFRPHPLSVEEEVARDTSLLEGLVCSGRRLQKLAALDGYFNMTWHGEAGQPYRRSRSEHSLPLLSDPDPEIRSAALRMLAARDPKALEPRIAEVRAAWPPSTDIPLQLDVLQQLTQGPITESPRLHSLVLEKVQGLIEGKDRNTRLLALGVLESIATASPSDALDGCVSALASLFRGTRDHEGCRGLLATAVKLPLVHLRRVLEEALASAPGSELRMGIEQVLHEIKVGETRPDVFRRILDDALGSPTLPLEDSEDR
jgi:hypothetical protein